MAVLVTTRCGANVGGRAEIRKRIAETGVWRRESRDGSPEAGAPRVQSRNGGSKREAPNTSD